MGDNSDDILQKSSLLIQDKEEALKRLDIYYKKAYNIDIYDKRKELLPSNNDLIPNKYIIIITYRKIKLVIPSPSICDKQPYFILINSLQIYLMCNIFGSVINVKPPSFELIRVKNIIYLG